MALVNPLTGGCGTTPVQIQLGVTRRGRVNGRLTTGPGTGGSGL